MSHVVLSGSEDWIPTDDDLKKLAQLSNLTSVDFSGCAGISRKGIMSISFELDKIKSLTLNACPRISNTFLESDICRFRFLEKLDLSGCLNISDTGVAFLSRLRNLKHLDLSVKAWKKKSTSCGDCVDGGKISDQCLQSVGRIVWLKTLNLSHRSKLTDKGLSSLATLRNLMHLNLSWTGLTDSGLEILKFFPELRSLDLSGCSLTEKCPSRKLNVATSLSYLNLSNVPGLNDVFLKEFTALSNLQCLCLSHCKNLTDAGLQHLTKFQSLARLEANDCEGITGKGVVYLGALPHLQELQLNEAMDANYNHILQLTNLQRLEMGIRAVDAEQLMKLTVLETLKDLMLWLPDSTTDFADMCVPVSGMNVCISVNRALMD